MEEFYKKIERDLEFLLKNSNAICFAISQNKNIFTLSIYPQLYYYRDDAIILLENVKMPYIKYLMYKICIKKYNFIPIVRTSNNFSIPNMPKYEFHNIMYFSGEFSHIRGHKNKIYHISLMKPDVIPTLVGNFEESRRMGNCRIVLSNDAYQDFLKFLESHGRFDILLKMEI
jgi:hypothetical protein